MILVGVVLVVVVGVPGEAPAGQTGKDGEKRNGKRIDGKEKKRRWRR